MVGKFEIDDEVVELSWKGKRERKNIYEWLNPFKEFVKYDVYGRSAELFAWCFKGHVTANGNLKMIDYGYALDAGSIEKWLDANFANDENEYLVSCDLMSMDYEKYYKNGSFINQDGIDTGHDFYDEKNYKQLEKQALVKNHWITVVVFDINKDGHGKPWPEGDPEWLIKKRAERDAKLKKKVKKNDKG